MKNKTGLIMGLANEYSIAYGIAKSIFANGGNLIFTAQSERFRQKINALPDLGNSKVYICDVAQSGSIEKLVLDIKHDYGKLDFIVHSIAFSDRNELKGKYFNTSRENFLNAMNISCFSLTELCKFAPLFLNPNSGILTLTYYGAEKVVPNYNVMGVVKASLESSVRYLASDLGEFDIRINAISAGPIKTLASSGVGEFSKVLSYDKAKSPLRKNVTKEEVGSVGTFLLSDMATGITGEIIHVDCGSNIVGITF